MIQMNLKKSWKPGNMALFLQNSRKLGAKIEFLKKSGKTQGHFFGYQFSDFQTDCQVSSQ